ncbi:MAG: serine hydrolase domain-containing protein [Bacteroidota bacterium]
MRYLVIFSLLLFSACQKKPFIPIYDTTADLTQQLDEIYQNGQLPGFAVAIVNEKEILFEKTVGYADIANKVPYTNNTQQNIASISKTFIGIALMQAVAQGKLSLDQPINDLLPFSVHNPNHPTLPITARHLATHTSSINDSEIGYKRVFLKTPYTLNAKEVGKEHHQFFEAWAKNTSSNLGDFLRSALTIDGVNYEKKRFSKDKPGQTYQYSNLGASLLAYLIEIAVNQPFSDYVQQTILRPLALSQTRWSSDTKSDQPQATTYFQDQQIVPQYENILYPAGGLYSTPHDLSQYLMALLKNNAGSEHLLSAAAFQEMISPQLTDLPPSENRGIMWAINDQQAGHNGGNYGVTLFFAFDKEKAYGRLFMTNISSYKDRQLIPQMVEIWKLLEKEGDRLTP